MNKCLYLLLILVCATGLGAQEYNGGNKVYTFLTLPASARASALGNSNIAHAFESSSIVYANPALLSHKANRNAYLNYQFFYAGINNGSLAYSHSVIDSVLMLNAGIQFSDYGDFEGRDIYNGTQGTFSAKDLAFHVAASYQLYERVRVGLTTKFISSQYEIYTSNGLAFDLGAHYQKPGSRSALALVVKNMGTQLKTYDDEKEALPLDVQLGFTTRFEHLPLRFQFVYHHLNQWNLYHEDSTDPENGGSLFGPDEDTDFQKFSDNLLRHFRFSAELALGSQEQVYVRISYDRQMNRELSLNNYKSLAGLGAGFGLNFGRLNLDYGMQVNHLAGGVHYLGLGFDIVPKRKINIID